MKTLRSYVCGNWYEARTGFTPLVDPCSEATIAQASSQGLDFGAALEHARKVGGAALAALTFAERGELLKAMSGALHAHRDELIELSLTNSGVTRKDAKFDLDGASGTLAYYAALGRSLGDRKVLLDGEGSQLGRSARFWGQHVWLPLGGVAVQINAFNFPAWGFAEKAAVALLAGMPIITKPATSTALVAYRAFEILVEAEVLPRGAAALICGATGDLVDRLGPRDVLSFTGSADTALKLRSQPQLIARSVRLNVEADSLNAAVLAPDVEPGSECWNLFIRDVEREITQKAGQKCTAVRRVLVPSGRLDEVEAQLSERLAAVVTGNPVDDSVRMGPLVSARQLADAVAGVAELSAGARIVHGSGARVDGVANPAGKGYFFAPTLLRADDPRKAAAVHSREVFAPVATLLGYDGSPAEAGELVGLGGGSLVSSLYSDDLTWVGAAIAATGSWSGRLYLGSEKSAEQALGSGAVLPQTTHGGPGRAGGGEELGGVRGLELCMQRVALQGNRGSIERLYGRAEAANSGAAS